MKILITGGLGYIGSKLTEKLLEEKHKLILLDANWFGNFLPSSVKKNKNLRIIIDSINNISKYKLKHIDTIIHLANVANDPAGDLDSKITWEVNSLQTKGFIEYAIKNKIKRFIYASSGSVYGVKKEKKVHEDLDLVPISDYNKTKMVSERILLSYKNKIQIKIVRPATVCGFSSKMRLDLSVNMLTIQALKNKRITLFGGSQIRPNININDMVNVYIHMLNENSENIIYNAGNENLSLKELALMIKSIIPCKIDVLKVKDIRSYKLDSTKLLNSGFKFKYSVEEAIIELKQYYENNFLQDDPSFYNLPIMLKKLKKIKKGL